MKQKVFVVFEGEYSHREIAAIFDTRTLAEKWIGFQLEKYVIDYDIQVYVVNKWASVIEGRKAA